MGRPPAPDEGITAVVGTLLVIIIMVAVAGVAFFMFDRLTEEKLDQDTVYVAFNVNENDRTATVTDAEPNLQWGVDLLVSGDCGVTLNGGPVSGPVLSADVLECAGPGSLVVRTSDGNGNVLLVSEQFD